MRQPSDYGKRSGYALVVLLVFAIMALTLISAAVNIMLVVTQSASQSERSHIALSLAEAGVEEALLRSMRNPGYSGGPLTVNGDTVTIGVSGTTTKTIVTEATIAGVVREASVTAQFNVDKLMISSWTIQ